jgi:hypothetical protein
MKCHHIAALLLLLLAGPARAAQPEAPASEAPADSGC